MTLPSTGRNEKDRGGDAGATARSVTAGRVDRREFLKWTGAGVGTVLAARLVPFAGRANAAAGDVFAHGVASGDPLADGVILWTRATPMRDAMPGSGLGKPVEVAWQVARDPRFVRIVKQGTTRTSAARDHTVKIDLAGLDSGENYFYRFKALNELSPVGRTRTAPSTRDDIESLRFGLASCANYEGGYFSAYRYMAERDDLDFILHMGDYLYEYGPGGYGPGESIGRVHTPDHEIVSLADYRIRHAQYKTDSDLQALHAAAPFIAAWDDHEVTNDTWREGAENHQPDEEGKFLSRRNRAYKAYFEWMPIRLPATRKDPTRIYRRLQFGPLADLHMLDTRQYRDEQPADQFDQSKDDPARTITGDAQMEWLKKGLGGNGAQWRLIGNQLMITPWETGENIPFNVDAWDGYSADRQELLDHVTGNEVANVVFFTGDIHTSWATEVPIDSTTYPATPPAAVELVGPSITSDNADEITGSPPRTASIPLEQGIKADNPYVKYVELDSHGYSVVDVTRERLQMDWYFISDRTDPGASQTFATAWQVQDGSPTVSETDEPI